MQEDYKSQIETVKMSPESKIEISQMKEGIWVIKKILNDTQATYLLDHVNDLPIALSLAQFESVRYEISKAITDMIAEHEMLEEFRASSLSIKKIVDNIFKYLRSSKNVTK